MRQPTYICRVICRNNGWLFAVQVFLRMAGAVGAPDPDMFGSAFVNDIDTFFSAVVFITIVGIPRPSILATWMKYQVMDNGSDCNHQDSTRKTLIGLMTLTTHW